MIAYSKALRCKVRLVIWQMPNGKKKLFFSTDTSLSGDASESSDFMFTNSRTSGYCDSVSGVKASEEYEQMINKIEFPLIASLAVHKTSIAFGVTKAKFDLEPGSIIKKYPAAILGR